MTHTDDTLVRMVAAHLDKVKGPSAKGWYKGQCPFHTDRTASFGFSSSGYRCHAKDCGRQGSLRALAEELSLPVPHGSGVGRLKADEAHRLLQDRGLRPETIARFELEPDERRQGWRFPVGSARASKIKHFDSSATPKYWWAEGQPDTGADVYNIEACTGAQEVWLVEGEPDVWIAHQAGIPAVSLTGGATKDGTITGRMRAGVLEVVATGVEVVNICMDNDAPGKATARSLAGLFGRHGVRALIRPLTDVVGHKGDITDLYAHLGRDDESLRVALRDLPTVEVGDDDAAPAAAAVVTRGEPEWETPVPLREVAVPPFPTEVLPGWMRAMIEQISVMLQTPTDIGAMFSLAVLSTIWARRVTVEVRPRWIEPINLYLVIASESGTRKSPVYKPLVEPVSRFEIDEQERVRHGINLLRLERGAIEDRLKKVQAAASKAESSEERQVHIAEADQLMRELDEIGEPIEPRLLADSVTPEKLVSLLAQHGGRMAILEPEGGLFGMLAGRYSGRPDLTGFLKGHAGEDIRVDRIGRGSEIVRSPALTLGLALQPGVVDAVAANPELRGTGLLARFLYSMPKAHVGQRDNRAPAAAQEVMEAYNANVLHLLTSARELDADEPVTVRLTPDAAEEIAQWMDWIEPRLGEFGELGALADWGSKLAGHTARVAALLHLADDPRDPRPWDRPMEAEVVRRAITIGRYLVPHARAAHALMGQDPAVAKADHVWRWMKQQDAVVLSARDIFEGVKGRLRTMRELRPALELLVEHGYLREQALPPRPGPGRKPSPRYDVNPLTLSQDSQISRKAS